MGWHELMGQGTLTERIEQQVETYLPGELVALHRDAKKPNVFYAKVQHDHTRIWVVLLRTDHPNMVRFMREEEHPFYYGCPIEWLDTLPEARTQEAREWRANVKGEHHEHFI